MIFGYTEAKIVVSLTGTITASKGSITTGSTFTKTTRGRFFAFATYLAPSDAKHKGSTDLVTIKIKVGGEKVLYQVPMFIY